MSRDQPILSVIGKFPIKGIERSCQNTLKVDFQFSRVNYSRVLLYIKSIIGGFSVVFFFLVIGYMFLTRHTCLNTLEGHINLSSNVIPGNRFKRLGLYLSFEGGLIWLHWPLPEAELQTDPSAPIGQHRRSRMLEECFAKCGLIYSSWCCVRWITWKIEKKGKKWNSDWIT